MTEWISRSSLKTNTGGEMDIADEVLGIFQEQVDTWGRMLDIEETAARWADAAHTIKGAALGIGALPLAEACAIAETKGRETPPPSRTNAALLLNDIRDALFPTLEEVSRIRYEISTLGYFRAS